MPEDEQVTLYDFFEALIDRVPWRTEKEVQQYRELIQRLRDINLFGYMSETTTVDRKFSTAKQGIPNYPSRRLTE